MPGTPRKRTRHDGSVTYQARWRPSNDGRDSERRTKTFGSKREALRWITQMDANHATGIYTDPRHGTTHFARIAEEWQVAELHHLKPKTKASYSHILAHHLIPAFGSQPISRLTPASIQTYVNRFAQTHKPQTTRNVYGVLARILAFAVRRRYVATNPADAVRLPRTTHEQALRRKRQTILAPSEIKTLADAMPTLAYRAAVYLAAYTGLRAGELWALQRKHIDLLRRTVTIERAQIEVAGTGGPTLLYGPPKSAAAHRTISIPKPVAKVLAAHLQAAPAPHGADALVFRTPSGHPVRQTNFYKRVFQATLQGRAARNGKPAIAAALPARLHGLRFHDLRHTCASLCLASTPNLHLVKQRLGHEDIRTTINIYGHMVPNVDAALADALGDLFDQQPDDNVRELRADADDA